MLRVDTLRVSVTDRCNLRCRYCTPWRDALSMRSDSILSLEDIACVVQCMTETCDVGLIRITGGEPLARNGVLKLVRALSHTGVPIALTTNGQRLDSMAIALRAAGVVRLNVSLDTLRPDHFERICRCGDLEFTLDGLRRARAAGFEQIRTNTVVLRDYNVDELPSIARYAWRNGFEPRFLELMRAGPADQHHRRWFVSRDEILNRLGSHFDLEPLPSDRGSTSRLYRAFERGAAVGAIGVIAPVSMPFCASCSRLRLSAAGKLIGCLMRDEGIDVRPWLRSGADVQALRRMAGRALAQKRAGSPPGRRPISLVGIGG